ncbi:MAG: glycosyltransferase [Candidatus Hydrogenedentes bacterium]|nr:glycosyltransferase [Candidatus Hydrogenedentota bacterium]
MPDTSSRLRVCIVCKATPFIWVHHYVKAFRSFCDVVTIGSSLTAADLEATGRTHLAHLVTSNDVDRDVSSVNELVEALPDGWRPDLVVALQSGVPQIENIDWLTCPTAHLSIDTWHDFAEMIHARPYDFVFAAQREFAAHFAAAGCAHAHWLPLACDPDVHRPMPVEKIHDLAFVGSIERSLHAERANRISRLAEHFSVLADTALDTTSMSRAYSTARLAFNSSVAQDINMRVFESMAIGVPLLTNRNADVNGLFELFRDREHLIAYDDDDLIDLARKYANDDAAREKVAASARSEVLANHTYAHRVQQLLAIVGEKVDWVQARAWPLLRGHGAILDYLPTVPGHVADYGMNAGVTKYSLRGRGVQQLTGVANDAERANIRRGSYDGLMAANEVPDSAPFDTVLALPSETLNISEEVLNNIRGLLRCGGTLVVGLTAEDMKRLSPSHDPASVWAAIESLGYVVLRMELREAASAHDPAAIIVARKRERTLKAIAREVYERNPIPNLSLEETVARIP